MRAFKYATLLLIFGIFTSAFPADQENIFITEIIDCNLFKLDDGRLITLANVNVPCRKSFSSYREKVLVKKILKYEEDNLIGIRLYAEFADSVQSDSVYAVHLFNRYPMNRCHFNLYFLNQGFGQYNPEPESEYSKIYASAAQTAQAKNRGVKSHLHKKHNKNDRRFRIMGGTMVPLTNCNIYPLLAIGYRISKLATIIEDDNDYLSLACGIESYYLLAN